MEKCRIAMTMLMEQFFVSNNEKGGIATKTLIDQQKRGIGSQESQRIRDSKKIIWATEAGGRRSGRQTEGNEQHTNAQNNTQPTQGATEQKTKKKDEHEMKQ